MPRVLFCSDIHNKAKRILPEVGKAIEESGIAKHISDGGGDLWFCDTHSWISEEQRGDGSMLVLDTETGKFEAVKPESWNKFE